MKHLILIFAASLVLSACEKTNDQPLIKGKLVHRSCASVVVQVLDSTKYFIAQNTWQQDSSKPVYEHVFAVSNQCSFPGSVTVGQEFNFKVVDEDPMQKECVLCALFDNPPKKTNMIKVPGGED